MDLDRWDAICLTGTILIGAGLWGWVGLGAALTGVGVILLGLGVSGAWRR